ncbi:ribosomal protein s18 domain-containing protein [Phthorimaea operculella]|nr:ribosomal protein s18 domain-containing protein [Phthorimaea operculella]
MAALVRASLLFAKNAVLPISSRAIATTNPLFIKEILERKEGSSVTVEAVIIPSPRTELLVNPEKVGKQLPVDEKTGKPPCYMCSLGLDVKHTDVLILSQFVRSDGCMLPRRITGLCRRQQKKIGKMVSMAQKAGLMINLTPANSKRDPTKRREHKQFNTYYDERTIFWKRIPKPTDKFKR